MIDIKIGERLVLANRGLIGDATRALYRWGRGSCASLGRPPSRLNGRYLLVSFLPQLDQVADHKVEDYVEACV